MANKDLTDKELIKLTKKPPEKKTYIRERQGFTIRIMPTGSITFLHIYTFDKNRKEDNLGHYPFTSIADARKKHRTNLDLLEEGVDPKSVVVTVEEKLYTVKDLFDDYDASRNADSGIDSRRTIKIDILPVWRDRPANTIRRPDARELVAEVAKRAPGQGKNVLKYGRAMFSFALLNEKVEYNPFSNIAKAIPRLDMPPKDRVLSDDEIKLLAAPNGLTNSVKIALLLILTTAQRPGEVVGMHTREIDGEWWTVPIGRIKTRKKKPYEHRVYLSPLALRLIEALEHSDGYDGYLFPGRKSDSSMTEKNLAKKVALELPNKPAYLGLPRWTPHDLRRTAATSFARLEARDEYISAVLNHSKQGVTSVYNKYKYDKQKQETLIVWGEHLEKLIGNEFNLADVSKLDVDKETLSKLIWLYSMTKIAQQYNVSETAVRKKCKKLGIEGPPQGFWQKKK